MRLGFVDLTPTVLKIRYCFKKIIWCHREKKSYEDWCGDASYILLFVWRQRGCYIIVRYRKWHTTKLDKNPAYVLNGDTPSPRHISFPQGSSPIECYIPPKDVSCLTWLDDLQIYCCHLLPSSRRWPKKGTKYMVIFRVFQSSEFWIPSPCDSVSCLS